MQVAVGVVAAVVVEVEAGVEVVAVVEVAMETHCVDIDTDGYEDGGAVLFAWERFGSMTGTHCSSELAFLIVFVR